VNHDPAKSLQCPRRRLVGTLVSRVRPGNAIPRVRLALWVVSAVRFRAPPCGMMPAMSAIKGKGRASKMLRDMSAGGSGTVFRGPWFKYPASQSVAPGDDPPDLRSVDALDPVGRIAPPDDVQGKDGS
jgi:hypothetical protein